MSPLPGKKSIRAGLAAATCSLLGVAPAAAQKADLESSLMVYSEPGRVSTYELMAHSRLALPGEKLLRLNLTLDIMTGATPNGATPARFPQVFTRASGKGAYTIPAGTQPLDNTFQDNRVSLDGQIDLPINRVATGRLGAYVSVEYDYTSFGGNASYSHDFNKRNTTFNAGLSGNYDRIDPEGGAPIPFAPMRGPWQEPYREGGKEKTTVDAVVGVTQVINRRTLAQLNYSVSYASGYQNDPYKMLSVIDTAPGEAQGDPLEYLYEDRPDRRMRNSVYTWIKRHLSRDILEGSYRFLWDDWDVRSHTIEMRYLWMFAGNQHLQPQVRYYHQSRVKFYRYFLRDDETLPTYASADYRLNEMDALTVALRYGYGLPGGQRVNMRVGYYLQMGDSSPPEAIGNLRAMDLYPNLHAVIWQMSYIASF